MTQFRSSHHDSHGKRCAAGVLAGALAIAAALASSLPAQSRAAHNTANRTANTANRTAPSASTDLEPQALQALRTMSDQLRNLKTFSFTALIMREEPGTNGQMLDTFRQIHVQVARPNKLRMEVTSEGSQTNLWYDGQNVTMMPADGKFYTVIPAPSTIGATLMMLHDKLGTHMPLRPFLSEDPYQIVTDGLKSANVVGIVNVGSDRLLQLAFMEPNANWQLWLTGPQQMMPARMAIVFKPVEGQPRTTIEFSNWQLNPALPDSTFTFVKPEGAVQTSLSALRPRSVQQGGKTQ